MTTMSERLESGEQARGMVSEALRNEAVERTLNESLRRMLESVRPEGIFGATVERDGVTLIPCAEVWSSFGVGGGSGFGPATANRARAAEGGEAVSGQPTASGGSGGGGGGGARGRPVAVVVTSEGKTRVVPVVDVTKLMVAGMTTLGFVAFMIGQIFVARSRGRRPGVMTAMRFARALRRPLARSAA
ncbi:MAG TPA: spore germination protein GerW family protein [Ktedonobacterales bacterium]|nr:spore germination protein GerW family protein [Ktedonobacterales bacterium]